MSSAGYEGAVHIKLMPIRVSWDSVEDHRRRKLPVQCHVNCVVGKRMHIRELRMRIEVEMALNADKYTSRDDHDQLLDHSPSYEASLYDCCTDGNYPYEL